jgi:hypothetical protein
MYIPFSVFDFTRATRTLQAKLRSPIYESQTDSSTGTRVPIPVPYRSARLKQIQERLATKVVEESSSSDEGTGIKN